MAQRRGNNGGGRRSLGPRKLVGTRIAPEEKADVEARAAARSMTVNDYLAEVVREHLRSNPEERLDISA
jgi:hypothetical protein